MNGDEIGFLRSSGIDGSGSGVFATFIESDPQSLQTLYQINQKTSESQRLLDVTELPDNNIFIQYSSSLSGNYYEYFLRYFDSDLRPLGDAILVDTAYSHVERGIIG